MDWIPTLSLKSLAASAEGRPSRRGWTPACSGTRSAGRRTDGRPRRGAAGEKVGRVGGNENGRTNHAIPKWVFACRPRDSLELQSGPRNFDFERRHRHRTAKRRTESERAKRVRNASAALDRVEVERHVLARSRALAPEAGVPIPQARTALAHARRECRRFRARLPSSRVGRLRFATLGEELVSPIPSQPKGSHRIMMVGGAPHG